jgi:hypothetical protein
LHKCFGKGQALSGDFIISIAIFLFILAILMPLFGQITERIRTDSDQRELEARSIFVSDAIIKTAGYPADWNSTTVKTIGFSDNNRLNMTKIRSFLDMSYQDAKDALSLEDLNFNLSFYDLDGYAIFSGASQGPVAYFYVGSNSAQTYLDSQPIVWDLYYGGLGTPDKGNARNFYNAPKADAFNAMVSNQGIYKTIIIEDPQLMQSEVNIQGLKDFVSSGGILIFIGDADLISTGFSMHSGTDMGVAGFVANESDFINAKQNDAVSFNNSLWYFYQSSGDAKLEIFVADSNDPSWAFIGKWSHNLGLIYFLTDVSGTVGEKDLLPALNIVGRKIEHGTAQNEAASTFVMDRSAVLHHDRDQFVKIRLLVWK